VGTLPFMMMNFVLPTTTQLTYLILTGIFAAIAQFTLTYSYKYAPASEVAIYNYTNIVFSAILGLLIWNEVPDYLSVVGGAIIVIMAIAVYLEMNFKKQV
jgi:drug/metabolite transporter (DMT)-like permease